MTDLSFYNGKRVFVTGHTGFKGTWLCKMLVNAGAEVTGYALEPPTEPNLFNISGLNGKMESVIGDIRNNGRLFKAFEVAKPEIVFHLAAQPIVLESYNSPHYTYETNVMGTVNILECIRQTNFVKSFVNVTTDKVYENKEWSWGYRENEPLDGYDPYSNSKSCSELITHCYKRSLLNEKNVAISTARAGNVIGGGDFAQNRIVPDCVRAAMALKTIAVRNPNSVRPYQHVLEPLFAYLMIAQRQYEDISLADSYNVGPDESGCLTTGDLAKIFCNCWGDGQEYVFKSKVGPHEANFLKLDCSKLKCNLGWVPRWDVKKAIEKTVEWTKIYINDGDVPRTIDWQIDEYLKSSEV
ncbi:MAG TPA: CDP-glucose 4,6-dehydratase [Clostridia bacterium]|nr:CDP-glucose 4,6-dehydratase [Clostridia bacterium]